MSDTIARKSSGAAARSRGDRPIEDQDRLRGGRLKVVYGLLAIPLFVLAMLSTLILDAPWAAKGWGAALAWFVILDCFALPIALLAAMVAMDRWRWPPGRAARIPLATLPGFVIAVLALLTA
jgi:hypothetical protein